MGIPGVSQGAHGDVEEFLAQSRAGHPGAMPHDFAEFEQIYQGAQPGRPMGEMPGGPMAALPGLTPSLHVRLHDDSIRFQQFCTDMQRGFDRQGMAILGVLAILATGVCSCCTGRFCRLLHTTTLCFLEPNSLHLIAMNLLAPGSLSGSADLPCWLCHEDVSILTCQGPCRPSWRALKIRAPFSRHQHHRCS